MGWLRSDIDDERRTPDFLVKLKSWLTFPDLKKTERELGKSGMKDGHVVLDMNSGVGTYPIAAARIVGEKGRVHALDLHPARLEHLERWADGLGLGNLETIYSDLETGLPDKTVDFVVLRNVVGRKRNVCELLRELHRVAKPGGTVYLLDSRARKERLTQLMVKDGFFHFMGERNNALYFRPAEGEFHEI